MIRTHLDDLVALPVYLHDEHISLVTREGRTTARTNQYVDLVSRQPVREWHNLEVGLVQRHTEVYHERVDRIVVIRDLDIQVLFCSCMRLDNINGEWGLRAELLQFPRKNSGHGSRYCPSGYRNLEEELLNVCGRNDGGAYCGFRISWRGEFFRFFFSIILIFLRRLAQRPEPQELNGPAQFLCHRNGVIN